MQANEAAFNLWIAIINCCQEDKYWNNRWIRCERCDRRSKAGWSKSFHVDLITEWISLCAQINNTDALTPFSVKGVTYVCYAFDTSMVLSNVCHIMANSRSAKMAFSTGGNLFFQYRHDQSRNLVWLKNKQTNKKQLIGPWECSC